MSFDTTFDFSINESTIEGRISQFQKMLTDCENEIAELKSLELFVDITSEKITEHENSCKSYGRRVKEYQNLLSKIQTVKNLDDDDKQVLYEMYNILQNGKKKFIEVVLDRYRKIIDQSNPVLADQNISLPSKEKLFNIIFEKEEREQRKSEERRSNLLRDPL
jgi:hypothetical protein